MHQPSAVGVAREAAVDGKGLYLKAEIVDDDAWRKVREGVYKGFSIGGAVTGRDPDDPKIVTGVDLAEISLVDRPANPEAVFSLWKSADDAGAALKAARARLKQKWVASDGSAFDRAEDAARHQRALEGGLAKATFAPADEGTSGLTAYDLDGAEPAGEGDYADPGYQPDHQKRYPLDTEERIRAAWGYIHHKANQKPYTAEQLARIKERIVAAWKAKIDRDGPPGAQDPVPTHLGKAHDPDAVQAIHDHAVAMGAHCATEHGAKMAKLLARNEALEDRLGAALPLLAEVRELVAKIAAQPAVPPPARLIAVDKGADVARELERIAEQPPALTALELIKRAVREPLPFGARLER
jgi:hypothetical protein